MERVMVRLNGTGEKVAMLKVTVCEHAFAILADGPQTVTLECRDCRKTYTVVGTNGTARVTANPVMEPLHTAYPRNPEGRDLE